ncbi:DUF3006 domain-containing protein [Bacillus solitudinis]|uniref:DUF3006 domain-containing protein n=1 Tax=Bacillus solitudinis TaxID=2014074 RepID=UPI000C23A9FB|nr:DUF3006 domain-containing protein [Bacillus solitudinis]
MKKYTVDRIVDNNIVVLLLGGNEAITRKVPLEQLPKVGEGDIIEASFNEDGTVREMKRLTKETSEARSKAASLLEKLKNKQ